MLGRIFGAYVLKPRIKHKIVRGFISLSQDITQKRRLIEHLEFHAPARARDLDLIGVRAATIARAVNSGDVLRLGRGLYTLHSADLDTNENLIEIAKRAPKAVRLSDLCVGVSRPHGSNTTQDLDRHWRQRLEAKDHLPENPNRSLP